MHKRKVKKRANSSNLQGVVNLHVDAKVNDGELQLLHNVLPGPATRSYGIEVAELAGFPKHLIDVARSKAKELEKFDTEMSMFEILTQKTYLLGSKKKSAEEEEALEIVKAFMEDFKKIPLGTVKNKQGAIVDLKKKYIEKYKNPIIQKYLNAVQ
jgi:DNA mismatch repair ATPase MutS